MAVDAPAAEQRRERLREQRRALPDQPGVYLFRDARGRVIYVGKAKSIRKRVAEPLLQPDAYGTTALTDEIDHIESLVVATEAEALLTEQNFIKQYKPRFNIRLRDDKSYPYIAISLDEDFPRVYFTRERHKPRARLLRAVLVRQARARHARPARQDLPVPLLRGHRARPPLRLAVPGLLHQALRGALRRLRLQGGVPRGDRRRRSRSSPGASSRSSATSSGACTSPPASRTTSRRRSSATGCRPCARCWSASGWPTGGAGTYDAVAVAVEGTEANAQVFQVRDGVLCDRQSFYLDNQAEQDAGDRRRGVHAPVLRERARRSRR